MNKETELQMRLRKAKEELAYAQDKANEARRALKAAEDGLRIAKEKYETLFLEEDWAEHLRRKENYRHCTK